jgi:hypothetical protein
VEHAIYGTLMNRNTNVGPHTVLAVLQLDSTSMVAFVVVARPFYKGPTPGGSSRTPTSIVSCRSDVDEDNNISKGRLVKTKIGDNV